LRSNRTEPSIVPDVSTPAVVLNLFNHLGLCLTRSLGRQGIPVYCVHRDRWSPGVHSRYCRKKFLWDVNRTSAEENVGRLLAVGKAIGKRSVLYHTTDETAVFVAEHADSLREWYIIPPQAPSLVHQLTSKEKMHFLAVEHGIDTAETGFPKSRRELSDLIPALTFPVMLKGIDGQLLEARSGKKMVLVRTEEELLSAYDLLEDPLHPNLMVQEYIPGEADSVWMIDGYFTGESECLFLQTGRKIRQSPKYTGYTSLGVCSPNPIVESMTRDFMKRIGYAGILDMGYRFDERDGKYKVLDINPRIGATFRLFVGEDGMDVARASYLDLTGQHVPPSGSRPGRKWLLEDRDLLSSIGYFFDGKLSPGQWFRSFRGVEESAYFSPGDMIPFIVMCLMFAGYIFSRIRHILFSRKTLPSGKNT